MARRRIRPVLVRTAAAFTTAGGGGGLSTPIRLPISSYIRYELASEQAEVEAQHSFEIRLLQPLQAKLRQATEKLCPANVEILVHVVALGVAHMLESGVVQKQFNELGAMLLCEHVRLLMDALGEFVMTSVRNEFSRLSQMAFLLNAGSVHETAALLISSSCGGVARSGGVAGSGTHLSRVEAARVLSLRSEFTQAQVREILPELHDSR